MYTVYILFSEKLNRFYIGATSDFDTRWHYHQHAENHKFTHKASDWILFLSIACTNKTQAFAVEKHIKAMKSKTYIQNLKKYPEMTQKLLQKYGDC
ncbi:MULTISPECIES: GIY-YIG nuclease family protein [unclassified Flavobacterium]|uniref:GIY-YIG nuclease family protein n=1 Tax=unclassified Flavobacterium TaxID=196869 RepID=UPI001F142B22|nr:MULTISPECIES: GIY-YIG nuclease family protein [unclassified Flavobacterium]UMY66121.1 GIY-YIG nuclease family protein [Flavobacterium sp. HJ-32-4]